MLAAPAVAPGDGWGISANPNVAKPNLAKPHFGENLTELKSIWRESHRIQVFNFTRCFLRFFPIWRIGEILTEFEEVQGTSTSAAHRSQPILANSVAEVALVVELIWCTGESGKGAYKMKLPAS